MRPGSHHYRYLIWSFLKIRIWSSGRLSVDQKVVLPTDYCPVNTESHLFSFIDVIYTNTSSLLDALETGDVDMVIMDTFSLPLQEVLDQRKLKIAEMIDTNSGYGLVLGGNSRALASDVSSQIMIRESQVSKWIEEMKKTLPVGDKDFPIRPSKFDGNI